jgi:hypothetical protein
MPVAALLRLIGRRMLTPNHEPRDQMANASSSNATATRWFTGSPLARS